MIDPGLRNKVALVTGANNPFGIGAAIAEALATQGASVFITYLRSRPEQFGMDAAAAARATTPGEMFYRARNADAPDAVLDRLRARAARVESAEFDLADPEGIPRLFDRVEETLGPVEILINNAAHSEPDDFSAFAPLPDDWAGRTRALVDAWIEEDAPDLFVQVKERVAEGRWEPIGGSWVEPDSQITGGESFVRQLLYGQRAFAAWFGKRSTVAWLPDVFGFSGGIPQLL